MVSGTDIPDFVVECWAEQGFLPGDGWCAVHEIRLGWQGGAADRDPGVEVGEIPGDGFEVRLQLEDAGVAEELDAVPAGLEYVEEGALGDAVDVRAGFDLDAVLAAQLG